MGCDPRSATRSETGSGNSTFVLSQNAPGKRNYAQVSGSK